MGCSYLDEGRGSSTMWYWVWRDGWLNALLGTRSGGGPKELVVAGLCLCCCCFIFVFVLVLCGRRCLVVTRLGREPSTLWACSLLWRSSSSSAPVLG